MNDPSLDSPSGSLPDREPSTPSLELLRRAVVVMVEPWEPGNIGATCRAMNHFGCRDLRLVVANHEQRQRLKTGDARRFATHALDLLLDATFHDDLPSAVADCQATFAFTARLGRTRLPRHGLEEGSAKMAKLLAGGPIALVFGTEEKGLARHHLESATDLVYIPLPGPHSVLNLAQAVLIGLWELGRACGTLTESGPVRPPVPNATLNEREGLQLDFERALAALDYGRTGPGTLHDRILRRFMDMHDRAGNERDDASMLRGVFKRIARERSDPRPDRGANEPREPGEGEG